MIYLMITKMQMSKALVEALSKYYYAHDMSFDGLNITFNRDEFEKLKEYAILFYRG